MKIETQKRKTVGGNHTLKELHSVPENYESESVSAGPSFVLSLNSDNYCENIAH
jgi:hypothetical protein